MYGRQDNDDLVRAKLVYYLTPSTNGKFSRLLLNSGTRWISALIVHEWVIIVYV